MKLEGKDACSRLKAFENPNGWRADVTWSAPHNPSEILSVEDEDNLPFKFAAAYFHFMKPAAEQKQKFSWATVLEQAQQENGSPTGRVNATGWSEFVYWGRVSISKEDKFNCATDCLVLYHWGTKSGEVLDAATRDGADNYTVHMSGRMPPKALQNSVP